MTSHSLHERLTTLHSSREARRTPDATATRSPTTRTTNLEERAQVQIPQPAQPIYGRVLRSGSGVTEGKAHGDRRRAAGIKTVEMAGGGGGGAHESAREGEDRRRGKSAEEEGKAS